MTAHVITSVIVDTIGAHDRIRIWNRGGYAGELIVTKGDGLTIRARLLGFEAVHLLSAGRALCDLPGVPSEWPEGHLWVSAIDQPEAATCPHCVETARTIAPGLNISPPSSV